MSELSSQQNAHIATQQEKLDALFGITNNEDLDTFLSGLSLDEAVQKKDKTLSAISELSSLEQNMQEKMDAIQSSSTSLAMPIDMLSVQMCTMEHSLKELEDIIDLSKDIIRHVHQSILATPLIDSEAVQAYGKLVESIHVSIAEFVGVYRDKQNFVNKVKFSLLQHDQKKELMRYKADLTLELMKAKEGPKSIDADSIETQRSWVVDDITKIIDKKNATQDN